MQYINQKNISIDIDFIDEENIEPMGCLSSQSLCQSQDLNPVLSDPLKVTSLPKASISTYDNDLDVPTQTTDCEEESRRHSQGHTPATQHTAALSSCRVALSRVLSTLLPFAMSQQHVSK